MRVYGPNGTALRHGASRGAPRGRRAPSARRETSHAARKSRPVALRTLGRHRCADRAAGRRGSGRAPPPGGQARRAGRSTRSTSSSSGCSSGTLDQATLLRLKAVAADLKEGSGDDRLDQVLARDRAAGRGRARQSRHLRKPLKYGYSFGAANLLQCQITARRLRASRPHHSYCHCHRRAIYRRASRGRAPHQSRARSRGHMQSVKSKNGRSDDKFIKNGKGIADNVSADRQRAVHE